MEVTFADKFNHKCGEVFAANKAKGFHDEERDVPETIALIHSELSEALEAHRTDAYDTHITHRYGLPVEMADAVIRIMDWAGSCGIPLGNIIEEKLTYNATRPHKHGKRY